MSPCEELEKTERWFWRTVTSSISLAAGQSIALKWGNPVWPFMPSSAFGCVVFDSMIAPWFLAGAPSFLKRPHAAMRAAGA
jgi:hypothetical protein